MTYISTGCTVGKEVLVYLIHKQTSPHLCRPALVPVYLQKLPVFFARKRVHANFLCLLSPALSYL